MAFLVAGIARGQKADSETPSKKAAERKKAEVTKQQDKTIAAMDGGLGFTDYQLDVRAGFWYPVRALVQGGDKGVRGRLIFQQQGNPLKVTSPIEIGKGATKLIRAHYLFTDPSANGFQASNFQFEVRLEAEGEPPVTVPIPAQAARGENKYILVIHETPGSLNFLNRRVGDPGDPLAEQVNLRNVNYGSVDYLPEDSTALETVDALIISSDAAKRITREQWEAVAVWVAGGGKLLVACGRHYDFMRDAPIKELFGVGWEEPRPLDLATIPKLIRDEDRGTTATVLATPPTAPPGGWDDMIVGDENAPLIAARRMGRGWAAFSGAALDAPLIEAIRTAPWRRRMEVFISARPDPASSPVFIADEPRMAWLDARVQGAFGIVVSSPAWVFGYLLAYILLAMPLNWWVCRRLNVPGRAWSITVLVALAFTLFGYMSGHSRIRRRIQGGEFVHVVREPGLPHARATGIGAVFSPVSLKREVDFPQNVFLHYRPFNPGNPFTAAVYELGEGFHGGRSHLHGFMVFPWSARSFVINYDMPVAEAVTAAVEEQSGDGPVRMKVTNPSAQRYERWWVYHISTLWKGEGALDPGETAVIEFNESNMEPFAATEPGDALLPAIHEAMPYPTKALLPQSRRFAGGQSSTPSYFQSFKRGPLPSPQSYRTVFLGLTRSGTSPFAEGLRPAPVHRTMIYEQRLELGGAENPPGGLGLREWEADVSVYDLSGAAAEAKPAEYVADGSMLLPQAKVLLQFVPTAPPPSAELASMKLVISLAITSKEIAQPFKAVPVDDAPAFGGRGRFQPANSADAQTYHLVGLQVTMFNFKTAKWEHDKNFILGTELTFSPAGDYMKPVTGEVALWMHLDGPDLLYSTDSKPGASPEVVRRSNLVPTAYASELPDQWQVRADIHLESSQEPTTP